MNTVTWKVIKPELELHGGQIPIRPPRAYSYVHR
jgi:hypothetical protein